uniref:Uncharacterized protein n=1 Tax=Oryza barthii TaxID=65489 RepID=A0A0D3GZZ5_9ORYZ
MATTPPASSQPPPPPPPRALPSPPSTLPRSPYPSPAPPPPATAAASPSRLQVQGRKSGGEQEGARAGAAGGVHDGGGRRRGGREGGGGEKSPETVAAELKEAETAAVGDGWWVGVAQEMSKIEWPAPGKVHKCHVNVTWDEDQVNTATCAPHQQNHSPKPPKESNCTGFVSQNAK